MIMTAWVRACPAVFLASGTCANGTRHPTPVRGYRRWQSRIGPAVGSTRQDTLQQGATDVGDTFFFDDQSDDVPQPLTVLVPSHPVVQGATGVLAVYPDHMHEGEVMVPTGAQLTQTSATDTTLSFAGPGFTEFPTIGVYQAPTDYPGNVSAGSGGGLTGHVTEVPTGMNPEDIACENTNFSADASVCVVRTNNTLAAYDGPTVNVGRIVTDSSFHHFLDLNLLGDPCSLVRDEATWVQRFRQRQGPPEGDFGVLRQHGDLARLDRTAILLRHRGKTTMGSTKLRTISTYSAAFYLFLEGRTPNVVGASPTITFSGSFNSTSIPGLSIYRPHNHLRRRRHRRKRQCDATHSL